MTRLLLAALVLLALPACRPAAPAEHYGFVARLGRDTVSVESVTRRGNEVTSDAVDRFPVVRRRHTEIELAPDGGIRHLVMDIHTPSEPTNERERHVVADVTRDSVRVTKTDGAGTVERAFATGGGTAMAHVPQMYSLYELYFDAALKRAAATHRAAGDTVQMRQFYVDREFDRFPLHHGIVRPLAGGRAEIMHDWLSGIGEATFDSAYRMQSYSGARTTYLVDVQRVTTPPDVRAVADRFEALETKSGPRQLSVRDVLHADIGAATFTVDYGRPLARGRTLLGEVIPYDRVWRTGANAATEFTTSAPITLAGLAVPAGKYTLWTLPHPGGAVELIVNRQTGQWGTGYGPAHDLGRSRMTTETLATPVEQFTISVVPGDARHGTLAMAWGPFRWTAPIEVRGGN
ncbi:Protein of unknown function DUF2911 (plasmid) [Gemmatirosa kalamazoonensis]|uniref:DUF2911 domain-containing protein n=1 Tax=Gemmatirosa kalamazoonensis TaxID=861299 RepID=W0RT81_9BACT|nr:DUF2911 domain-containing protein [Gemmatirosa kalamazoonensis]AHG92783.1 Protein of unknown function DUF2911 [Gemmatirosa kalamazoonensis]